MNTLKWLDENLEKLTGIFSISAIIILLFVQVVSRYVFDFSLAFAEEASLMLFVIFTYLGASLAIKRRQHLRITLLVNMLSPRMQKLSGVLVNILFFIAVVIINKGMWIVTGSLFKYKMTTPILGVPKYIIYGAVMAIMTLMLIRLVQDTVLLLKEFSAMKEEF